MAVNGAHGHGALRDALARGQALPTPPGNWSPRYPDLADRIPPRRTRRFPEGVDVDPDEADARALGHYVLVDARCDVCGRSWPVTVTHRAYHCGQPVEI